MGRTILEYWTPAEDLAELKHQHRRPPSSWSPSTTRAAARQRAWDLAGTDAPGAGGDLVTVDLDATIVTACSEKDQAGTTWKKTYGFHPLTVFADHGAEGGGEPLAILLRPGNAGSNTAADHIAATKLALAQLQGGSAAPGAGPRLFRRRHP